MRYPHGADSEVGRLRTVLLHRPGPELKRLTPRNNADLLFDGIPWVGRAQEEHDGFAQALSDHGVEVLYVADLLSETLEIQAARAEAIDAVLADPRLGETLQHRVADYLHDLHPDDLGLALTAGVAHHELPTGAGLRWRLMDDHDFVVEPLPNLLFTRDSSVWVRDSVAVTSPFMPARRRETTLTGAIYAHHPRFAGTRTVYEAGAEWVEGGDVLLLTPGVLAVGTGQRTTPAGVERLARRVFEAGVAHTVLAVPIAQERATMHLDTICTMVDADAVVMYEQTARPGGSRGPAADAIAVVVACSPAGPAGGGGPSSIRPVWVATAATMSSMSVNAAATAHPSPAVKDARAMPSSLANTLNGGRPSRASTPSPKTAASAGWRAARARTAEIRLVPVVCRIRPADKNSAALPRPWPRMCSRTAANASRLPAAAPRVSRPMCSMLE
jgi:arginine deiminase